MVAEREDPFEEFINKSCPDIDLLPERTDPPQLDIKGIINNAFHGKGVTTTHTEGLAGHKKPSETQLIYLCSAVSEMLDPKSDIEEDQFLAIGIMREAEEVNEESRRSSLLKKAVGLCLIIEAKDSYVQTNAISHLRTIFPTLSYEQLREIRNNLIMEIHITIDYIKHHTRD